MKGRKKVTVKREPKWNRGRRFKRPYPGGFNPVDGGRPSGTIRKKQGYTFPSSRRVKLKYGYHHDHGNSTNGNWAWRANSIYDPDKTSTGNQPLGFDQWAAFYSRYTVHACKIKVTASTNDNAASILLSLYPDYDGSGGVTVPHVVDKPESAYMMLTKHDGSQSMEYYCKIRDFFGLSEPIDNSEDTYSASTSGNPTNQAVINFQWDELLGATINTTLHVLTEITYYVEFHHPRELAQS